MPTCAIAYCGAGAFNHDEQQNSSWDVGFCQCGTENANEVGEAHPARQLRRSAAFRIRQLAPPNVDVCVNEDVANLACSQLSCIELLAASDAVPVLSAQPEVPVCPSAPMTHDAQHRVSASIPKHFFRFLPTPFATPEVQLFR